ncbi:hypothetical protein PIB30_107727 [Stylosanthes scabra]|uniref:Single-stranded DNA-binding protein n=1 Tax=Stylosanthes scabra TaxID=79078 RepID=A0ABU6WXK5_9FABA|nr:hypothetical protein [Stylosanthes scabra]
MAGETQITVVGNVVAQPELRFTPSGAAVANFTIASTPRTFDRQTNEWKDQEALFLRCSIWREAAENVAESLTKGQRVIAQGRLKARTWETKEGEKRTSMELDVDEIGPSLRFAIAQPGPPTSEPHHHPRASGQARLRACNRGRERVLDQYLLRPLARIRTDRVAGRRRQMGGHRTPGLMGPRPRSDTTRNDHRPHLPGPKMCQP